MNNCYANYGTTNAREIAAILAGDLRGLTRARDGPALHTPHRRRPQRRPERTGRTDGMLEAWHSWQPSSRSVRGSPARS